MSFLESWNQSWSWTCWLILEIILLGSFELFVIIKTTWLILDSSSWSLLLHYLSFSSLSFGGFYFLFPFIVAQLHACVVCIALPVNLAVVPTWGFYFVFVVFCVVFRKQICFGSEGIARDKLVFGMLKHGHVSFQILTWILLQFGFQDQSPNKHAPDCFFLFYFLLTLIFAYASISGFWPTGWELLI